MILPVPCTGAAGGIPPSLAPSFLLHLSQVWCFFFLQMEIIKSAWNDFFVNQKIESNHDGEGMLE